VLVLLWLWLGLPHPSRTLTLTLLGVGVLTYQLSIINIRDSVFSIFLFFAPIVFLLSPSRQTENLSPPPPGSCHPLFHFSPFTLPFTSSASLFLCLLVVVACEPLSLRNCPCQFVRVSWAEGAFMSVCYSSKREGRQVSNTKPSAPYTERGTSTGP
jgi:hypothetical protein